MEFENLTLEELCHKLREKVVTAKMAHDLKAGEEFREESENLNRIIGNSKIMFRGFLKTLVEEKEKIILPEKAKLLTPKRVEEMYNQSNFCWKNGETFERFYKWYSDYCANQLNLPEVS